LKKSSEIWVGKEIRLEQLNSTAAQLSVKPNRTNTFIRHDPLFFVPRFAGLNC